MEWERYDTMKGKDDWTYYFYSNGPKGRIRKGVRFQHRPELGQNVYNLFFGDYDEGADRMDDKVVSNNGDYKTILRTLAEITDEFVNSYPRAIILIRGATDSRSRLYQMGIAAAWLEIHARYEV